MPAETDLPTLLASLRPSLSHRRLAYCSLTADAAGPLRTAAWASVEESEGVTLILDADQARKLGLAHEGTWALITLEVHSSLMAVGLLAAVCAELARADVPVNAVAGYHHDHLLVPWHRREAAVTALRELSHRHASERE